MRQIAAICLLALIVGCGGEPRDVSGNVMFASKSIEELRTAALTASKDQGADIVTRMSAFAALVHSFPPGTSEGELVAFLSWDTKTSIGGDSHSLHLITPDGSDSWITLSGGKIAGD